MEKNIIIDIPFNLDLSSFIQPTTAIYPKLQLAYEKAQTREWLETRLEIFMKYTMKSLRFQTNQCFCCLIRCTAQTKPVIEELLQRYPPLPQNILFTADAETIIAQRIQCYGNMYRVVLDSDNMYEASFIERIQEVKHQQHTQSLLCQRGYVYDEKTGRLAKIKHPAPSFYVVIYTQDTYTKWYHRRLFENHWDSLGYMYEIIQEPSYCICIHEHNIDNTFEVIINQYKGQEIEEVLKEMFIHKWQLQDV